MNATLRLLRALSVVAKKHDEDTDMSLVRCRCKAQILSHDVDHLIWSCLV